MSDARPAKHVAVLLPDLRAGGAERLHLYLADEWQKRGIQVEFILQRAQGELLPLLPKNMDVFDLAAGRLRSVLPPLVRHLRSRPPDILLAAMWPLTVIAPLAAVLAGFKGRMLISEHTLLSLAYARRGWPHTALLYASARLFYPLAAVRIAVSGGVADDMATLSGLARDRFHVIHNPAALGRIAPGGERRDRFVTNSASGPFILSVGTLKPLKRHDLLIEAFSRLPMVLGATLCILGEGSARAALEAQVQALGLAGKVLLPGFRADTAPWYERADLFVLASDYEGFGNVIVEALEQGVPVVSTDCPSGPREILGDGKYGRLVPVGDPDALAAAMLEALGATHDHAALQARARDFSVDTIAARYLEVMFPESDIGRL